MNTRDSYWQMVDQWRAVLVAPGTDESKQETCRQILLRYVAQKAMSHANDASASVCGVVRRHSLARTSANSWRLRRCPPSPGNVAAPEVRSREGAKASTEAAGTATIELKA